MRLPGFAAAILVALVSSTTVLAFPGALQAKKGLEAARRGDCVTAVPLLEEAELLRHRPSTAFALAGCYVSVGELLRASELYHTVAEEEPARGWTKDDRAAVRDAPARAEEIDERIPTLTLKVVGTYQDLEVEIDGRPVDDLDAPRKVAPDLSLTVRARAPRHARFEQKVLLGEGERRTLTITLRPASASDDGPDVAAEAPKPTKDRGPKSWVGARFRGLVIPKFVMNAFGDAGTTVFVPGGGITYTRNVGSADVVLSGAFASYAMGETPFKPRGSPSTEYEIIESDLMALIATVDLVWSVPIDKKGKTSFTFGGGIGVGWTFVGDLRRTQAYPPKGAGSDPYLLAKCNGPNDPAGSYAFCNQLDKDATHYQGYTEPSWFEGGARPLVFPWLALPQVGISYRPSRGIAVDVEAGLTLSGILLGMGMRWGL